MSSGTNGVMLGMLTKGYLPVCLPICNNFSLLRRFFSYHTKHYYEYTRGFCHGGIASEKLIEVTQGMHC